MLQCGVDTCFFQVGGPDPPSEARSGRHQQRYAETGERLVAGCIPVRFSDGDRSRPEQAQVLLISSRAGKGWCFAKGGWETDESVEDAAKRETVEEAGVRGELELPVLGQFPFQSGKPEAHTASAHGGRCIAYMYVLHVMEELKVWPEAHERSRVWFPLVEAIAKCRHEWMKKSLLSWVTRQGWDHLLADLPPHSPVLHPFHIPHSHATQCTILHPPAAAAVSTMPGTEPSQSLDNSQKEGARVVEIPNQCINEGVEGDSLPLRSSPQGTGAPGSVCEGYETCILSQEGTLAAMEQASKMVLTCMDLCATADAKGGGRSEQQELGQGQGQGCEDVGAEGLSKVRAGNGNNEIASLQGEVVGECQSFTQQGVGQLNGGHSSMPLGGGESHAFIVGERTQLEGSCVSEMLECGVKVKVPASSHRIQQTALM